MRAFKYLSPLLIYAGSFRAFMITGWEIWLPMFYAWVLVPLLEIFIRPDPKNLSGAEEELAKRDKTYDIILYMVVILQYAALVMFLYGMTHDEMTGWDITGRIWVMGMLCGIFGINVGHELGHRANRFEQTLAKMLLLTSQYMHFFIEHNKGHHKRVATPEDPSSARYGEWVYAFYFRSIIFSYISAWSIAGKEAKKKGLPVFSLHNEMTRFTLIQFLFLTVIFITCGWLVTLYYLAAATIGILLLETVNYIEHYGLQRKAAGDGKYERAMPAHSWNSDHVIGRIMLFELSRHSDHHYLASRKYQALRHHDDSPQMPTGYPGMMLLSLIPPAWFYVMNRKVKALN
ncbi:MAG: alkane 1-monooxygenase [Chitinophagaceae bacterium]|nr:alkane 1-monooxygenase [Chitinophagaceae bacterium]